MTILNPYALVANRDDRTGRVLVVEIIDETELVFVYRVGPEGAGKVEAPKKSWLVTRSADRARMEMLRDMLAKAWADSSETLGDAKMNVAAEFAKRDLENRGIDVPRTQAAVDEAFTEKRQAYWRHVIDHLAAHPIDPVGGVKEPAHA
jgi:hypothetical protein